MQEKIQQIKNRLIEAGYLDNEWLDKYLAIIEANLATPKNRLSTQAHHAIPVRTYYTLLTNVKEDHRKAVKKADKDPINIKVNLLYKDHLLVHSYLTLCLNLEQEQAKYEAQADIRKQNSFKGVTATNLKRSQVVNKFTVHKKTETMSYLKQYFSEVDAEDIYNL